MSNSSSNSTASKPASSDTKKTQRSQQPARKSNPSSEGASAMQSIIDVGSKLARPVVRLAILLHFYSQDRTIDQIVAECDQALNYVVDGEPPTDQ